MGMFDNIECNYPLPLPLEVIDLLPDIYEQELQTKDLDCFMELYIINEEGSLLKEERKLQWKDDDDSFLKGYFETIEKNIKNSNYHGVVNFYLYERIYEDKNQTKGKDVSVDFLGKFTDGKLDFVELLDYSIEDATERINQIREIHKEHDIKRNKWYNKYIFYTKPVSYIRRLIRNFFYKLHNLTGKLHTLAIRYI